ncbi:magnesium/cobalt transporter CorA [Mycobacterium sp. M1]|uniref:Magnesium transport protein CorA n=1 Tax=Mycolicibacter acidiphilus TaxID=2835306 RepID=A0ABS5RLI8_9MYCO|nr:magnesium/cobalt transporter CorA [Mycolicibacter acidiphilus]MBS9535145.1 magnesium/cobalt transporter CorA [Mycolicibacter acidiphilus]
MAASREQPSGPALGRASVVSAMVDCGVYADGVRLPGTYAPAEALTEVREVEATGRNAFVWIGLHQPDNSQMQAVADTFGLHELVVEDAVHAHQRPKLELYDDTLFLVLKTVNYVPFDSVLRAREIVETGEIMVIVGKNFVITVRHGEHSGLADVRKRLDADPEHMRLGPYAVMHGVADYVVDRYVEVTNLMEADIDAVEEVAFSPGARIDVEPIYQLKREIVELRRAVAPLSGPFQRIQTEHRDLIGKEIRRYLRDVADHQTHVAEQIASYDEMLSSLVQAALARVGMQQNTDMRKISAWAAMLAVPTLIAGIYGMNFDHMPVLHWAWGYPMALIVMLFVCGALYRTFRRNGWL